MRRDGRAPVPDRRRAAARAPGRARRLGRRAAAGWSSRTTTTPSSATTASRSARSRGCAPERVVYAGSASKMLAPGLRLGLARRAARRSPDGRHGREAGRRPRLARHRPARVRRLHRPRRARPPPPPDAADLPGPPRRAARGARAAPAGAPAGRRVGGAPRPRLAAPGVDEAAIVAAAAAAGIGMSGITSRRITGDGRQGLVFGYGLIREEPIEEGVARLAEVIAGVGRAAATRARSPGLAPPPRGRRERSKLHGPGRPPRHTCRCFDQRRTPAPRLVTRTCGFLCARWRARELPVRPLCSMAIEASRDPPAGARRRPAESRAAPRAVPRALRPAAPAPRSAAGAAGR